MELICEATRCTARLPVTDTDDIAAVAVRAGWQYRFTVGWWMSDDDAGLAYLNRCPEHPAVPSEFAIWEVSITADHQEVMSQVRAYLKGRHGFMEMSPVTESTSGWNTVVRCSPRQGALNLAADVEEQELGVRVVSYSARPNAWGPWGR